jgi:hypothetical protein
MGCIIRERDHQDRIDGKRAFLSIVGLILMINVIVIVINKLEPIAAGIASLCLMLAVMALTYRVITRKVIEYNYALTDWGLVFERVIGRSEKPLLEVSFDDVTMLKAGGPDRSIKTYYFLCDRQNPNKQTLVYKSKGREVAVVFNPSDKMLEAIQKRIRQAG